MPWPIVVFFVVVLILKSIDKLINKLYEDE